MGTRAKVRSGIRGISKRGKHFGVGINDSDYVTVRKVGGKKVVCPYFRSWKEMIKRCYSEKCHERQPTYKDCYVADEWHSFMTFKKWMEGQDWKGKHLDKDLLVAGNKAYSPETCLFVDGAVNKFLHPYSKRKGANPMGVFQEKRGKKFVSQVNNLDRNMYLGTFNTPEEAHAAWQRGKLDVGLQLLEQQTHPRVIEALSRVLASIEDDLMNGRETKL